MAIFKCKMCGGALEINGGESVVTCEYCGTQQTLPKLDDERRANLYDRANHFRRNNEFDKAMGIYEQILNENNTDAEAYWSIVLCRYGIEYVEDPSSHKRVPTVNRAQFTSVFDDDNYKSALQYADSYQRAIYEEEAKTINEIQKGILAISQKEEPFDVFICYKESDNNGRRTPDSVLANDLYHQLTQEGFKVFFARITLEDKLGSAYEPYIFAALNSSKVMVALGTKPEYFKAVWVRNEWSRYLSLIKQGQKKMLIPAYKDMDPYDLPEEFSHLQAQDMSKLGFMQDLIRGIKKILQVDEPKATVVKETVVTNGNTNTAPLLERAFMFLEDGDWNSANEYCEKVLDLDPKNAQAYVGKLMAEIHIKQQEDLKNCSHPFDERNNFQKAMRFGDDTLKKELQGYIDFIVNRNLTNAYDDAVRAMEAASSELDYKRAAEKFEKIRDFKDAKKLAAKCLEDAEEARLNAIYMSAKAAMESATTENEYKNAASKFEYISEYRDSAALIQECLKKAEEAKWNAFYSYAKRAMDSATTEAAYKDVANKFKALGEYQDSAALAKECYEKAEEIRKDDILFQAKAKTVGKGVTVSDYEAAIKILEPVSGWRDADERISTYRQKIEEIHAKAEAERLKREREAELAREATERKARQKKKITIIASAAVCAIIAVVVLLITVIIPNGKYNNAVALLEAGKYDEAIAAFDALDGYKDSAEMILECKYGNAVALLEAGKYDEATTAFNVISAYKDSAEMKLECKYLKAAALLEAGKYKDARSAFENISTYKDSKEKAEECNTIILESDYNKAVALLDAGKYEEAKSAFRVVSTYKDSATQMKECDYRSAVALMKAGKYAEAITTFNTLDSYKDSKEKIAECNAVITENNYKNAVALMDAGKYTAAITAFNALGSYKDSVTQKNTCISLAYNNAVALMNDGKRAEAAFTFGALGNYKDAQKLWMTSSSNTIAAGYDHVVGLKKDGTVVAAGTNKEGECTVNSWNNIVSVAAGDDFTVGLKSDGTVVATGYNFYGQCNVSGWRDIVAIAAGDDFTVGLKKDGTVVATGSNSRGQCDVSGWTDIVAVAASYSCTLGLKADGTVVYAGNAPEKVSSWSNIVAVAGGGLYSNYIVGLKNNGTVVGTSISSAHTNNVAVAAGDGHYVLLKADGTVVATGSNSRGQCDVSGWTDIVDVAACNDYTIGLKSNGTVVYTGELDYYMKKMSNWYNIKTP